MWNIPHGHQLFTLERKKLSAYRAAAGVARGPLWEQWHHLPLSQSNVPDCFYFSLQIILGKLKLDIAAPHNVFCERAKLVTTGPRMVRMAYKIKNIHTHSVKKNFRLGLIVYVTVLSSDVILWPAVFVCLFLNDFD